MGVSSGSACRIGVVTDVDDVKSEPIRFRVENDIVYEVFLQCILD